MEGNVITNFCPKRVPNNTRGPSEDLDGPGRPWGLCSHRKGPGPLHPCRGFLGTCPSSSPSRMFAFLLLLPFPYVVSLWLCTQPWEDWGQVRRSPFHVIHIISRGLERKTQEDFARRHQWADGGNGECRQWPLVTQGSLWSEGWPQGLRGGEELGLWSLTVWPAHPCCVAWQLGSLGRLCNCSEPQTSTV